MFSLVLTSIGKYQHPWPDGGVNYDALYFDAGGFKRKVVKVIVGFTEEVIWGRLRPRVDLFVDGKPTVRFTGADDYAKSGLLLSLIKKGSRTIPAEGTLPLLYFSLKVVRYSDYFGGKGYKGAAVAVEGGDLRGMIQHAFNHKRMRGELI